MILPLLENRFKKNKDLVHEWLESHKKNIKGPFYTSVDIRNGGFKIAAVDTNVFPGGWNNLCASYMKNATELAKKFLNTNFPDARKLLVIPENHTRNRYYLSNLKKLEKMLSDAGFEVCIGTINPEITEKTSTFLSADEETVVQNRVFREGEVLKACDTVPDLVILNNDLSDGTAEIMKGIHQRVIPSPLLGWSFRKKSDHCNVYKRLTEELADILDLDPWFFYPITDSLSNINVENDSDLKKIAENAEKILKAVATKYKEHEIHEKPYIFIKNNRGTYGMGVEKFESADELLLLNRKHKNKLRVGKGKSVIHSYLVQEGIPTIDRFKNLVAEPVLYLIGNEVTGGFFRLNDQKDDRSNLNSKGMKFSKLCFHDILGYHNKFDRACDLECLTLLYKMVAQVASLSAGYEELTLAA